MILTIGQLLLALSSALLLLVAIWFRPGWIVFSVISIVALLDCFEVGSAGLEVGVNFYLADVAGAVCVLSVLILLLRRRKGIPRDAVPCLLLLALVAVTFARGISVFGLKAAGNSARNLFTFVAPALAIMMLRPVVRLEARRLATLLVSAGSCLSSVALLRWTGALPMPAALQGDLREIVRAVPSDYAIVIGQAFIAAVYLLMAERRKGWWWWAGAGILGIVTIFLQHRSVWVAAAAGLAWLAFKTCRVSPTRLLALGAVAVATMGCITLAYPAFLESAQDVLITGVSETQSKHSTWAWRVDGYTEATDRVFAGDAVDMLIGPPAGWAANSGASFASIHIHSRYVDTLAYYGVVGTAVLLCWFVVLIKRSWGGGHLPYKNYPRRKGELALAQALLIAELIYLVPYFGGILQGAVLGALWLTATQEASLQRRRQLAPMYLRLRSRADLELETSQG